MPLRKVILIIIIIVHRFLRTLNYGLRVRNLESDSYEYYFRCPVLSFEASDDGKYSDYQLDFRVLLF